MIKKNVYTGTVLIILGILFLLYNLNMFNLSWILFLLSIFLIIRYLFKKDTLYLVAGLGLFAFSSVSLIDRYVFIGLNIQPFIYLLVGGLGLIYLFYKGRERNWLVLGSILLSLALNNIIGQLWPGFLPWGMFFLLAGGFYLCYLIIYRTNGIVWPKYISYLMLAIGGILMFVNKDMLAFGNLNLAYLFPILLIIIGARVIYLAIGRR